MLGSYLKTALRTFWKRPGSTVINVVGLALGIASCLLIGLWVQDELSYDDYHEHADRIYRVTTTFGSKGPYATTPSIVAPVFRRILPEVETAARLYDPGQFRSIFIQRGPNEYREDGFLYADSTVFDVFSYEFLAGSPETALIQPNSVVLTRSAARKYFGNEDPMGNTITLNDRTQFEVTGLIENVPDASHFHFDVLASLTTLRDWSQLSDDEMRAANFYTYVRLESEEAATSLEQTKIPNLFDKFLAGTNGENAQIGLQPVTQIHLYSDLESEIEPNGDIRYVYIFGLAAVLILLIACANYVNLTTARAARRAREVGMRKALGAQRGQLAGQFLGESLLLTAVALALAMVAAKAALPLLNDISGKELALPYFQSPVLLLSLAGLALAVGVGAGTYPALVLSSFSPARALRSGRGLDPGGALFRKGLVVVQFGISVFLLLGTGTVYDQLSYIQNKKLGFDKERVVVLPFDGSNETLRTLKGEVEQHTNVRSAAAISDIPGAMKSLYRGAGEGVPSEQYPFVLGVACDPDVTETLDLNVVAGRGFGEKPAGYTPENGNYVYLLNEAAVRELGWTPEEAVGKWFNLLGGRRGEVVGVIENFHYSSMRQTIEPLAFYVRPGTYQHLMVKLGPGDVSSTLAALEGTWSQVIPDRPFTYSFLDQEYDALYRQEQRAGEVLGVFSVIAMVIACLGLFGLAAYATQQRSKEIGVRKALGASTASIAALLTTNFVKLIGIAFVLAAPLAYVAGRQWLVQFAYRTGIDAALFAGTAIIAVAVGGLAVGYHAIRAASADPARVLQTD